MARKASLIKLSDSLAWESNPDGTSSKVLMDTTDIHAQVDASLGLYEPGEVDPQQHEQRLRDAIETIGVVWDFCFENGKGQFMDVTSPWHLQIVLRRFVVLTLMFRAKRLPDHTLRSIAKLLPKDVQEAFTPLSRVPVSKIGLEAVKRFSFQSRVQKPAASIENYKEAAKRGHAKRKANAKAAEKAKAKALKQKPCQATENKSRANTAKKSVARKLTKRAHR